MTETQVWHIIIFKVFRVVCLAVAPAAFISTGIILNMAAHDESSPESALVMFLAGVGAYAWVLFT